MICAIAKVVAASAGDYRVQSITDRVDEQSCVHCTWLIASPRGPMIRVSEGLTLNPLDCVLSQPASVLLGAWSASHIWHGYPAATLRSVALSSPVRMPLNGVQQCTRAWELLSEWDSWGYTFVAELQDSHRCGQAIECPATVRTTADNKTSRLGKAIMIPK